jgi:hypothetical protein
MHIRVLSGQCFEFPFRGPWGVPRPGMPKRAPPMGDDMLILRAPGPRGEGFSLSPPCVLRSIRVEPGVYRETFQGSYSGICQERI